MAFVGAAHPLSRPWKWVRFLRAGEGGEPPQMIFLGAAHPPENTLIFRSGWGGKPPIKIIFQIIKNDM